MFFVFAVWALFGFSYPSTPIPFALNALSKVLSFVAGVTLFLPKRTDREDLEDPARGKAPTAAATIVSIDRL
jgi:hypothetical protein